VEARYPLPEGGSEVVAADGRVWILNDQGSTITAFDPVGESFVEYDLPAESSALAAGLGYVWVVSSESRMIMKLDASSGMVVGEVDGYELEDAAVAVGDGAVWIIREHSTPFLKVDPNTLGVERLPFAQRRDSVSEPDLDVDEGILWGSNAFLGRIMSLDPETGSFELAGDPRISDHAARGVVANRDAIWVSQPTNGSVTRIDTQTREVSAIVEIGATSGPGFGRVVEPYFLVAGPGGVWVSSPSDGKVVLLGDENAATLAELAFERPTGMTATLEAVWVLDGGTNELVKLAIGSCTPIPFIGPDADLRGCDLSGKALTGMDLTGADLRWADLRLTSMQGADLTEADLYGSDVGSASLSGITWSGTRCPDGALSDEIGRTCLGHLDP
jgi:sugar lactone lactonase YvrE